MGLTHPTSQHTCQGSRRVIPTWMSEGRTRPKTIYPRPKLHSSNNSRHLFTTTNSRLPCSLQCGANSAVLCAGLCNNMELNLGQNLRITLRHKKNRNTFPQIFIKEKFLGSCTNLFDRFEKCLPTTGITTTSNPLLPIYCHGPIQCVAHVVAPLLS